MSDFRDNFTRNIEFFKLDGEDGDEIMPIGTVYDYVVPVLLNAFVNYVSPIRAYLVTNYEEPAKNEADVAAFARASHPHTNLATMFSDDVVLFAQDDSGAWWYFFFDRGARGSVGRFRSDKSKDVLLSEFDAHAREMGPATELPIRSFRGWISY